MGIPVSACCCQPLRPDVECIVPGLESEHTSSLNPKTPNPLLNNMQPLPNISSLFEFICSSQFYSLLLKDVIPKDIINKVAINLSKQDLIKTILKVLDWISIIDTKKSFFLQKLKTHILLSKKTIISDLQALNTDKDTKEYYFKTLSDLSSIVQYIQYTINNQTDKNYNINYWKGRNGDKDMYYILHHAIFQMIQIKMIENEQIIPQEKEVNEVFKLIDLTQTFLTDVLTKSNKGQSKE